MFSIIVPLWNKRETVAETIASVLAQSFRDFELIVVDDGSTDGSIEAVNRFDDPRLTVISQANAGVSEARNAGMEATSHDWIAFLDADDIWLPDHLAELDRIRTRFPEAGLIGTSFVWGDRNGRHRLPRRRPGQIRRINYFERVASGENVLATSSAAMPRGNLARFGGFGAGPTGEDTRYWMRIALDLPVAVSTRRTVIYRHSPNGLSASVGSRWRGRRLREPGDVSHRVKFLLKRYPEIESPEMRRGIDRYIDRDFRWCLRSSARAGDLETVRALPALLQRRPGVVDRFLLAVGRMPAPFARFVYGLGFRLYPPLRRLGARLRG